MAGVVFVFVREDASEVEILAEAFDAAGYSITGSGSAELSVIVWSRRALRSEGFRFAAERALRSGRAVVAAIFPPPPREAVFDAPVIDLSQWNGVDEAALDPLLRAADDIVHPIEAHVIVLPADPSYDVVPRRAPVLIASADTAPPAEPKLGAPSPRRDFGRTGAPRSHAREHAALAFLLIAMVSGGAFVVSVAANTASYVQAERMKSDQGSGVSLTSASSDAIGLEDIAPEAPAPIGRRGVEPPSAVHHAAYEP